MRQPKKRDPEIEAPETPPDEGPPPRAEVTIETAALVPNPRNPRKHDEAQVELLAASLRRDGQTKPLLVRLFNRMIIAGHGIHQAALAIGLEQLRVVMLDVDQADADRIMLGDNRHSDRSKPDNARVTELLREIDQSDWMATGYTDTDAQRLFDKIDAADLVVHEIESSERHDTFWISVYGPLSEQAKALQGLKAVYKDMPKITVMLGTTPDLR